uniref:Flap endonuclease GEN n=1 Tax=Cacopsylla melanoneura TaxID=428564 RepID=A0A8D8T496_9HEMI
MGVKDLWTILTPICERKPIWELQDKTIAIDLSAWICDSSTVAEHCSQKNMYLRNLFFRTSYLLLLGVKPIFVLEGKAPVLKHDTIEKRQQAQGRAAGRNVKAGSRARLKGLQTQCAALLSAMGLKCIQGDGEAEAFCALLNQAGLVDGVVTQDSDVFLYGGVKVYRHFNTSCAGGGSVDTYEMAQIHSKLGLGRHKLIALSLLCGCDYNKGVNGVGKESALKFFQSVPDEDILDRIQQWRQNTRLDNIDLKKDKTISAELKCELQIRAKALQDEAFPCQEVLDEFLQIHSKDLPQVRFEWNKPNISQFLKLADVKLAWDSTYALEKALPLLTRWHLTHNDSSLTPELILNAKTTRGVKGYVVKWEEFEVTTEEPQALFEDKYPHLVQSFVESKTKGKKKATKKNKENENPAAIAAASQTESSEELKPKTKTKTTSRRVKNATTEGNADILNEINEESNDVRKNCDENEVNRVDKIKNKTKYPVDSDRENDNKSNENKTVNEKKPERKKKEPSRRKNVTSELKKKTDKKLCENNRENVDIRRYFKPDVEKQPPLANVSRELFDESMCLLDTSMNSLSIRTENVRKERKGAIKKTKNKLKSDKACGLKDVDVGSIQGTVGRVKKDTGRNKRDVQISLSDQLDASVNNCFPTYNSVSSDMLEGRKVQNSKQSPYEDIGTQNKNKHQEEIDIDVDDILDFSFETACRIMSRKNKELGLNQSLTNERVDNDISRDENIDKFEDIDNSENRFKDVDFDQQEHMYQLKERDLDKFEDMNNSEVISEVCHASMIENIPIESEMRSSRENEPQYLEMTDFIMSINDSDVKIDKDECFDEIDKNSLELPEEFGASKDTKKIKFIEKKSDYLDMSDMKPSYLEENKHTYLLNMSDMNMSINTSEVKLNESLVQANKISGFSLRETNSVKNVSIQICNNENKISQDFRKQTNHNQSRTVENVDQQIRTDNVDLVTESISYMSFTEDTSSPCRVTTAHQYESPIKDSLISNIGRLSTSSQNSPEKSSQRNHQIDYTKFTSNNLAWNTSSPLMRYSSRSSLLRVNPTRVSNPPNCESPLRVKYQSRIEGQSPLRVKNNRFRFDGNSPVHPGHNLIAPRVSSITPNVNQAAGVSFDMDDFEFDEGIEDLSGIIDNIIGQ